MIFHFVIFPLHFIYLLFITYFLFSYSQNYYQNGDPVSSIINEKGCLQAGEAWLETNVIVVAGVAVGIAFLQVGAEYIYFCLNYIFLLYFALL